MNDTEEWQLLWESIFFTLDNKVEMGNLLVLWETTWLFWGMYKNIP